MDKEQEESLKESYKDFDIFKLLVAETIIGNHLDTYFKEDDYGSFWDFLEESLIITRMIKEKPFLDMESLMMGLKSACEYCKLTKNQEKADFLSYKIAYLQKLAY